MELITMENLDKKKFENAKKRVKKEKDFYTHLTVYIVINSMLIIINLGVFQSGFTDIRIPKWPMFTTPFFWGIGLFFHWLSVFKNKFAFLKNWEEKKIKEYMEKEDEDFKKNQRF
jgi:hypothetical protein